MPWRSSEVYTSIGAAGAAISPWWLPILRDVSEIAGILAPILGALWLIIQMSIKLSEWRAKRAFRRELRAHLRRPYE